MLRLRRRAVSDAENVKTFHNSLSEEFRGSLKLKPSTFKKNYKLAFVDFFCSVFFWILEGLAFFVVTLSCFNWFVASPIVKEWQVIWIQTHRHHGEIKKKLFLISKRNLISLQLIICPSILTFPNFHFQYNLHFILKHICIPASPLSRLSLPFMPPNRKLTPLGCILPQKDLDV